MIVNRINFKKVCKEYQDRLHRLFFPDESISDITINNNWYELMFSIEKNNEEVEIFGTDYDVNTSCVKFSSGQLEEKISLTIFEDFKKYLSENNIDRLIHIDEDDEIYTNVISDDFPYVTTGRKSQEAMELLRMIPNLKCEEDYGKFSVSFDDNFPDYQVKLNFDGRVGLEVYLEENKIYKLTTIKEVRDFIDQFEKEKEKIKTFIQEILIMVKSYDATSYFEEEKEMLHLFGDEYDFYVGLSFDEDELEYYVEFFEETLYNEKLDELMLEFKKTMESFLRKKRISAALNGQAFNLMPKLFYTVFGANFDGINFEKSVQSEFTKEELNSYLKDKIDKSPLKEIPKEELSLINENIKPFKNKYKLKNGYQFAGLNLFASSRKYFILKEEEIEKELEALKKPTK